jgi:hypothetical protein
MPYTISTKNGDVALKPQWESFRKGIDIQRGPYIEMSFLINDWDDGDAVVNAMMGGVEKAGSASVHIPAWPCPVSRNLQCTDAYVEGEAEIDAKDGGPPRFKLTKVRASFGIRTWEELPLPDDQQSFPSTEPVTYAVHTMDIGFETIKVPTSSYVFSEPRSGGGDLPLDTPFARNVGVASLNIDLKKVPYLPSITILKLVGKLNDALFYGAPRGQIIFMGGRTSKEFVSDGTRVQSVSYAFRYREKPWNYAIRSDTGKWDSIVSKVGRFDIYEYADLRPLIVLQGFAAMGTVSTDYNP